MSDTDSDSLPPLVDSSSDGGPPAGFGGQESDGSSEENDEEGTRLFRLMAERAQRGPRWHQSAPQRLLDDVGQRPNGAFKGSSVSNAVREDTRRAENEKRAQLLVESNEKEQEAARQQSRQLVLTEAYRNAQVKWREADTKGGDDCLRLLLECAQDCVVLQHQCLDASVEAAPVPAVCHLATALQAECLIKYSRLMTPTKPEEALKQAEIARSLLLGLPVDLPQGLRSRRKQLQALAHVACGCAQLGSGQGSSAIVEALQARSQLSTVDLGPLAPLVEDEQKKRSQQEVVDICNWGCGLKFAPGTTRQEKHRHRSETCDFRPMVCEDCGLKGIAKRDVGDHKEVCPSRLTPCRFCEQLVPHDKLSRHECDLCEKRPIPCPLEKEGCVWRGQFEDLQVHNERCPYIREKCEICLEDMQRHEMQSHLCPLVDGMEKCIGCEEFLCQKPVATLLRLEAGHTSRTCSHFIMCVDCAEKLYNLECESEERRRGQRHCGYAPCPFCRGKYNVVTAIAEHLVVWPEDPCVLKEPSTMANPSEPKLPKRPKEGTDSQPGRRQAEPEAKAKAATKASMPYAPVPTPVHTTQGKVGSARQTPVEPSRHVQQPPPPVPKVKPPLAVAKTLRTAPIAPKAPEPTTVVVGETSWPTLLRGVGRTSKESWSHLEARRPPPPAKVTQDRRDYDKFWISPLEIHFAHDRVSPYFKSPWHEHSILDTVRELAEKPIPKELECIDVVWLEEGKSRYTVAGTFNRRLVCFRLLTIFFPDRFRQMLVRKVPRDKVQWYYNGIPKLSTNCFGVYVEIRNGKYVGKGKKPHEEDKYGVQWPEAIELFNRLGA